MERFIFGCVAVAFILLGFGFEIWPIWFVRQDRDHDDPRPITPGDIWRMRVLGLFLIAGGGYGLYCILARVPGAEFSGV